MSDHETQLRAAFDDQAPRFERAPVQSDPAALGRLVAFADLPPGASLIDAGCGPGLVAEAFLHAGYSVFGVDLSGEMIERAERRCAAYGERARFRRMSLYDPALTERFDAAVSRFVLHHAEDPAVFVRRQAELLRPGGVLVLCDHTTDPDLERGNWHNEIERLRDRTHTSNPTPGAIVDLLASAGLGELRQVEESFTLDFDEWFDRGTPTASKDEVRARLLAGPGARGFDPTRDAAGEAVTIACWRCLVRGVKPA